MRKKSKIKAYLIFFFVILCLISIPVRQSVAVKGGLIEFIAPLWRWIPGASLKKGTPKEILAASKIEKLHTEVRELALENRRLITALKEQKLNSIKIDVREKKEFGHAIMAKVLYRSPLFWSDFLIIDAGYSLNDEKGKEVIGKGSPVISHGALVGVVDYVGKKMSRVRLISDEGLHPSVRALRGVKEEDSISLKRRDPQFLAKGILQGKSQPLWRSHNTELKGIGFNYDFSDEEGPARDLLTGKVEDQLNTPSLAIIKPQDLLVTSGLDGVFPEGIPVAFVKSVDKLKEGDFCFSIKAVPCIKNLNNLTDVFVLPSLSIHEESFIQIR